MWERRVGRLSVAVCASYHAKDAIRWLSYPPLCRRRQTCGAASRSRSRALGRAPFRSAEAGGRLLCGLHLGAPGTLRIGSREAAVVMSKGLDLSGAHAGNVLIVLGVLVHDVANRHRPGLVAVRDSAPTVLQTPRDTVATTQHSCGARLSTGFCDEPTDLVQVQGACGVGRGSVRIPSTVSATRACSLSASSRFKRA